MVDKSMSIFVYGITVSGSFQKLSIRSPATTLVLSLCRFRDQVQVLPHALVLGYQKAIAEGVWYNFLDNKKAHGPKCSPALRLVLVELFYVSKKDNIAKF